MVCVALLFLGFLALPRAASPCSCFQLPPEEAFAQSTHVFRGQPISIELVDPGGGEPLEYHYQIHVTACWKGDVEEPQALITLQNEAFCGVELALGEDYLIFANASGPEVWANLCSVFYADSPSGAQYLDWLGPSTCPLAVQPETWGQLKSIYR